MKINFVFDDAYVPVLPVRGSSSSRAAQALGEVPGAEAEAIEVEVGAAEEEEAPPSFLAARLAAVSAFLAAFSVASMSSSSLSR
jgi:hypothetical protein